MVVLKINTDTAQERDVKIISDNGTWDSGTYHIYSATSFDDLEPLEPRDKTTADYLGELLLDKENTTWDFKQSALQPDEQKEIAEFVMDYQAPDGVY